MRTGIALGWNAGKVILYWTMVLAAFIIADITMVHPLLAQDQDATATPRFAAALVVPCKDANVNNADLEPVFGPGRGGDRSTSGRLHLSCASVATLIRNAYLWYPEGKTWPVNPVTGRGDAPLSTPLLYSKPLGGPAWLDSDRYTIDARADGPAGTEMMEGPMMQALLEDRFRLKVHHENRQVPMYEMRMGQGEATLQAAREGDCAVPQARPGEAPLGTKFCGQIYSSNNTVDVYGVTMPDMCRTLSIWLDRNIIDKTGIQGVYNVHLEMSFLEATLKDLEIPSPNAGQTARATAGPPTDPAASLGTALQRLGLELLPVQSLAESLVIDHAEQPAGR